MASSPRIRNFRWQDLEQLTHIFNEVNGQTNSQKAFDVEFMRQYLSQPTCQPEEHCYVAETRNNLVGFVLIAPELPISRTVTSGGVLKSHRNRGIGRSMVRKATKHAQGLGASVLHVEVSSGGASAMHLLESEGFYPVRNYWQMRWKADGVPNAELPEGFSLCLFRPGRDEEALTQLQNAAFGDTWGFCPNTVEEISARARLSRVDPDGIILVMDGGRPAAYNWTLRASNEAGSTGSIAMTGVHPDYRGRGLGRAVVVAGMKHLRGRGVDGIELEVDSDNLPARELYRKLGFQRFRETKWYEKALT